MLQAAILRYLGAIRTRALTAGEGREVALAMKTASDFESLGDVIETDMVRLGYRALAEGKHASKAVRFLFNMLGDKLDIALADTIQAIGANDQRAASRVLTMKAEIDHLLGKVLEIQAQSLATVCAEEIEGLRMEITAMENIKRIYTHLKRIAREIVPQELKG